MEAGVEADVEAGVEASGGPYTKMPLPIERTKGWDTACTSYTGVNPRGD